MIIGLLTVELRLPMARSLKDKRRVLTSLEDKCRNKFNVAVAETGNNELWKNASLGLVTLSNNRHYLDKLLSQILEFIEDFGGFQVIDYDINYY